MGKQSNLEKEGLKKRKETLVKNEYNKSNNDYIKNFTKENSLNDIAQIKRKEQEVKKIYNEDEEYGLNSIDMSENINEGQYFC